MVRSVCAKGQVGWHGVVDVLVSGMVCGIPNVVSV